MPWYLISLKLVTRKPALHVGWILLSYYSHGPWIYIGRWGAYWTCMMHCTHDCEPSRVVVNNAAATVIVGTLSSTAVGNVSASAADDHGEHDFGISVAALLLSIFEGGRSMQIVSQATAAGKSYTAIRLQQQTSATAISSQLQEVQFPNSQRLCRSLSLSQTRGSGIGTKLACRATARDSFGETEVSARR